MTVEITIGDAGELRVLAEQLEDTRGVLDGIGALMQQKATEAFRRQGRGQELWRPRGVPNVAGIVGDLNRGGFPKARRFDPRPALVDTGRLRNSITWKVAADGQSVTVGTSVPYAVRHNEGLPSEVTLTPAGREQLSRWLRRDRRARDLGLGWLFSQPTFTVRVPERRFLEVTREDRDEVVAEVERAIAAQARGRGRQ